LNTISWFNLGLQTRNWDTHSPASRDVSVVLSLIKPIDGVLLLLLERDVVEVTTNRELVVDALLRDVEVLDVKEALLANGGDEGTSEFLLACWGRVEGEIDGDQVGPVKVGLG